MKKLKIFLMLSILLCFGFVLRSEVHAQGVGPKVFEVDDILPATTQLRISWISDITTVSGGSSIKSQNDSFVLIERLAGSLDIYITKDVYGNRIYIWDDGDYVFPDPYTNYDGDHPYCDIDTSTWDINKRTISSVSSGMDVFRWEDLNAPQGFSITFEENGGTEQTDLSDVTTLPDPLPIPTKENHTFLGWYYDSAFTQIANAGDIIESNVTLYAKWELNVYVYKAFEIGDVLPAGKIIKISWDFRGKYMSLDNVSFYINGYTDDSDLFYIQIDYYSTFWIWINSSTGGSSNLVGNTTITLENDVTISDFMSDGPYDYYEYVDGAIFWVAYSEEEFYYYEEGYSDGYQAAKEYYGWNDGGDWFTGDEVWGMAYDHARDIFGYYDPITDQWLSVTEYLDLYGTDKPGQSDFYTNFDKYFIPAMIIVFGGAIVLTILKVFKGRE